MTPVPKDDPKNIFGFCMYDWANSAYGLTVAVGVLPTYFASVVVGGAGLRIGGIETSATAVWAPSLYWTLGSKESTGER